VASPNEVVLAHGVMARAARIFHALERRGVALSMLNTGGGFPAHH
jgi:diaminopimelate decarboxylase